LSRVNYTKLRQLQEDAGLTHMQVAMRLNSHGVKANPSSVSRHMAGKGGMSLETIAAYAAVFSVSVDSLLNT